MNTRNMKKWLFGMKTSMTGSLTILPKIQQQQQGVKKESKRPQSAVGLKRPTSEYSRIAKGLGDLNPRYKFDNIL